MKLLFASLAALLLASAPALAQAPPGGVPLGAGEQRGMQELNNSGQSGYVTLLHPRGGTTQVVTALEGVPAGHVEGVVIERGSDCDNVHFGDLHIFRELARPPALEHGISRGVVNVSEDKLLSGNYIVVVYSSTHIGSHAVACGYLYK